MEIKAREQQFQTLRQAFAAGQMDEAAFNAAVDQLGFQDGWGRYWAIGHQSGEWYYFNGQQWRQAYEQLKELTRGKGGINRETLHASIDGLTIPDSEKGRLKTMTPASYTGMAAELARQI